MAQSAFSDTNDDPGAVTQTIMRGLEVLRAFRNDSRPLSNAELSARIGLPKATVSRITTTLVALGYLLRIPSNGRFQLGPATLGFGRAYLGASTIRAVARPHMERLAIELNASVGLAIADRLEMIYILWCRSPSTMTLQLTDGTILPMGFSAIGKAYLAAQPAERRQSLISRLRRSAGEQGASLSEQIEASLREYQRFGYCSIFDGIHKSTFGIAVPIQYSPDREILSLSCGSARLKFNKADIRRRFAPPLMRAANHIREAIANADLD